MLILSCRGGRMGWVYFGFFLLFSLKLVYDVSLVYLNGADKAEFVKRRQSSVLFVKAGADSLYTLTDFFFDLIYFFKLKDRDWVGILLFFTLLFLFSPLAVLFFVFYILSLIYICLWIMCFFVLGRDGELSLATYSDDYRLLTNLLLSPYHWAKVGVYSLISFRRRKIDANLLDQMLLGRVAGSPFWIIKLAFVWSSVFLNILRKGGFERKSFRVWHRVLFEGFSREFDWRVRKKISFNCVAFSRNKIIIFKRRLFTNPKNLQELIFNFRYVIKDVAEMSPYVVELNGVKHQAIRVPDGIYYVFTTKSEVTTTDPLTGKFISLETDQLSLNNLNQRYTRSLIDIEGTKHEEGFLPNFLEKNMLHKSEDLVGLYTRINLIDHFAKFDYFFFQSNQDYLTFKFPNNESIHGKFLKDCTGSLEENELRSLILSNSSEEKGRLFFQTAERLFHEAKSSSAQGFANKELDPKLIVEAMGELYNIDNRALVGNLQKVDPDLALLLKEKAFKSPLEE